jgi:GTP-binding protein
MDLLPKEEHKALRSRIVKALKWKGKVFCISAADRSGTRELCEALMEAVADQKRQLLEDDDYRLQEQKSQEQMEYEIRQSITRARALWRERNNKDAGEDEDDDNFDVDVEYVRD